MGTPKNFFIGVAGSAAFYVVQKSLDLLPTLWGAFAAAVFGITCFAAAAYLNRSIPLESKNDISIMSDIDGEKSVKAKIDGLKAAETPHNIMTEVKSKGNIELEIKDTEFNVKSK